MASILQPGQTITASDGVITKELIIPDLKVTSIDQAEDIITGTADASREVLVVAVDEISYSTNWYTNTDSSGNWFVDFSGYEDLAPGTWGFVEQMDEDGDFTDSSYEIFKAPTVLTLSPSFTAAGSDPFKLIVNGENFYRESKILWNGVELETSYISSNQLSAVVPADGVSSVSVVEVKVSTPADWGGGGYQIHSSLML